MKTKSLIAIGSTIVVIAVLFSVYASLGDESLDMNMQGGAVSPVQTSPILGVPSAPITIIEFGDYQCPTCKQWFIDTKPELTENFINTQK